MERSHVKTLEEEDGSTKLELEFNLVCTLVAQSPQHPNGFKTFLHNYVCVCVCVCF